MKIFLNFIFKDAECGKIINIKKDDNKWHFIESPGYGTEDGYGEDQRCNWILKTEKERLELEFVDEFSFLCSIICLDFVELKLAKDQRATGAR